MLNHDHNLIITTTDLERLRTVLDTHSSPTLDIELERARVVAPANVPPDVVTMNSEIIYEDCDTGVRRTVRLVYPSDADAKAGRISVLAPIGSALIGLRVGQEISWTVPHGTKQIRVVEIRYQPEASGDFHR